MNGEGQHGATGLTEIPFFGETRVRRISSDKKILRFLRSSVLAPALFSVLSVSPVSAQSLVDYQRQIRPILEKHCFECHSQDKRKGGLSLATYDDALEGGRNGPVIRPGNGAGSPTASS